MNDGREIEDRGMDRFLVYGEECYVMYSPVKYTQWILVTLVPCRPIDLLSYLNGVTVLIIALLAIFIVVFVGYYYTKKGVAPLKQLSAVADDMSNGKYDTPLPEIRNNDEISQLRDSMEELQYTLSTYAEGGEKPAKKGSD